MMVIAVGWTAPAPRPCSARNTISAGMLQAKPHRIEPSRNSPMPISMIGLRPNRSVNLAKIGTEPPAPAGRSRTARGTERTRRGH